MPDVLVAIAKGLAGVPGLAPVFNPLIALREDEKTVKANDALLEKISEGQEVSREAVDDILVGILGIREDNLRWCRFHGQVCLLFWAGTIGFELSWGEISDG